LINFWELKKILIKFLEPEKFFLDQVVELKKVPLVIKSWNSEKKHSLSYSRTPKNSFLIEKFWNVKKPILELKRCWKLGRNQ
jgi:NAD dependent epimerase/dehydratase family enzyme